MPMLPDVQERPASMEATHEPLAPRPYGETLISLLARNAKEAPSRVAIREREFGIWREYSWTAYLREVTALAAGLEALGLKPDEPAVIVGDNRARLYFGMAAAAMLGAHALPLYPETPAAELAQFIASGRAHRHRGGPGAGRQAPGGSRAAGLAGGHRLRRPEGRFQLFRPRSSFL